jgi:hypothetical protein
MIKNQYIIFLKQFIFVIKLWFIITSEITLYIIFRDYTNFIYRVTSKLASINILYVKIFQSIASNNSLIDETTNIELIKFTDKAPWTISDIQLEELIDILKQLINPNPMLSEKLGKLVIKYV